MKIKIIFIIASLFSSLLFTQTATPPSLGDGSEGNPYQIATLDNLFWLSQQGGNSDATGPYWSRNYIQTANIDATSTSTWDSGQGFYPIGVGDYPSGSNFNPFTGSYDGQYHTIDGIYVSRVDWVGLFGFSRGIIINLGLTNVNIGTFYWTGGLVGDNEGVISNCYSTGNVNTVGNSVGGLVGQNGGLISNSYSICSVSGAYVVGGLVGLHENSAEIINCYSRGVVTGTGVLGGLVGANGITIIENSFWDTETSGQMVSAGGTGKTTAEMKDIATFTDVSTVGLDTPWDFEANPNDDTADDNYWDLCSELNGGYPILSWQNGSDICLCISGSIIYNTETNKFNFCEDGAWVEK